MIRSYCDICEHEINDLSYLPTRTIKVEEWNSEGKMFVCNRCYKKMCRIIKKSNAKERKAELKAIKNLIRWKMFDSTVDA